MGKKQKDRYVCRNCGEELETIIEIGVNYDIMALDGQLVQCIKEVPGFMFCPKCNVQLTKASFPSVPGSFAPPEEWKKAGKQALKENKSFCCPHCGVELKELIRIGIYRDEITTDFGLISCLDDKLRLVLCPKCKGIVTPNWLGWLHYQYTKKPSNVYPNPPEAEQQTSSHSTS